MTPIQPARCCNCAMPQRSSRRNVCLGYERRQPDDRNASIIRRPQGPFRPNRKAVSANELHIGATRSGRRPPPPPRRKHGRAHRLRAHHCRRRGCIGSAASSTISFRGDSQTAPDASLERAAMTPTQFACRRNQHMVATTITITMLGRR